MFFVTSKNFNLLEKYKQYCMTKGLTSESIKAFCNSDLPLFLKFIGKTKLKKIRTNDIQDFFQYCLNERKNALSSLERKHVSLQCFFKFLKKHGYVKKNPLEDIEKPKYRKKVRSYITEQDVEKMISHAAANNDYRGASIIALIYSSSCRISEIWQLNRNSLNFNTRQFKVIQKGQNEKICVFSEQSKKYLLQYLEGRLDKNDPLFLSRENNRWSKKSIQEYIKRIARECQIPKIVTPHILRHSRATSLVKRKVPIFVISKLLGHRSLSSTQIYTHLEMDDVQMEVDLIDSKHN